MKLMFMFEEEQGRTVQKFVEWIESDGAGLVLLKLPSDDERLNLMAYHATDEEAVELKRIIAAWRAR